PLATGAFRGSPCSQRTPGDDCPGTSCPRGGATKMVIRAPCYAQRTCRYLSRSPDRREPARRRARARRRTSVSDMRVLIVDDEEDMRALVRATIEVANAGLSVAGEAASGEAAVSTWREERPEVVVLDQRMP